MKKYYIELEIQDNSFTYNNVKYDCYFAIKTDKECILREAKDSHSDSFEELYDKSTLAPKKVRLFFNEQEDILYGMIIYTIKYRKDNWERCACGNYYPIWEHKLMPHLYQGSICW